MSPEELHRQIQRSLLGAVDPAHREGAFRFFNSRDRGQVDLYGVRAPEVKRIVSSVWRVWKRWADEDRYGVCELLWRSGKLEEGAVAIYLCRRLCRDYGRRDFDRLEGWIDSYVANWAHCDGVASWLVAACIANEPPLMDRLTDWTHSPNRWKRRAAAVSLIQEARHGRNTQRILEIADLLLDDADPMVQKGVGWLLKETYPHQPRTVTAYLRANRQRPARILLRYAAEKMTAADRASVLA